ncbi:hypothetical protein GCM10023116_03080 [Kistimonas scapharcae]|uniref:Uncharacterized protein n=1 Tax=Kistimonas scapharcae TaxID=1036133 RepID=A0ABP8UWX6_9GAMM
MLMNFIGVDMAQYGINDMMLTVAGYHDRYLLNGVMLQACVRLRAMTPNPASATPGGYRQVSLAFVGLTEKRFILLGNACEIPIMIGFNDSHQTMAKVE